jgi:signal transduction histidine kinase/CheY-like chemotaxis protein
MLPTSVFFENIDYIFLRCSRTLIIDHCNGFISKVTASHQNVFLGSSLLSFFHLDDKEDVAKILAKKRLHDQYYTHRFRKEDGSFFWFKWQFNEDENVSDYYIIGEDVSELKRVNSALTALETVTDTGYWEIDLDTHHLYWSDYVHRIHETNPITFKPKLEDGIKFYHPDSIPRLISGLQKLEETGESYSIDLNFITSKGKNLIVNATGFSEVINGRIVRNFGTFKDLTMQKEDEIARQGLEKRTGLALKAAKIGVWEYDIASDNLIWDDRLFEIYGRKRDKFKNRFQDWSDSVYPDDLEAAQQAFTKAIESHTYFKHEFRVVTNKGEIRSLLGMAACIYDVKNKPIKVTGVNLDLTESNHIKNELKASSERAQKNAQLAEKMAKQAKAADLQKSAFLANISHEIRTPISGVIGLVDMLLDDVDVNEVSEDKRQYYLGLIKNSSQHLLSIITDILDFSKIEAGKINITNQTFDLLSVIEELINDFKHRAAEKGLKFDYQSSGLEHALFVGDPHRLKQILYNLLGNAIKFTPTGTISVRVRLNKKTTQKVSLICSIIDTGIGIEQDKLSVLFKPFEQVDSSAKRRAQGTGLGLPISSKLIKLMGGNISVDSKFGIGSNFTISVPFGISEQLIITETENNEDSPNNTIGHIFENCHALVAEDNDINQVVIQNLLAQLNISCTLAVDGEEALAQLDSGSAHVFNFILMDCQMPKLDGFETTRIIRQHDKYKKVRNIPIIALTANAMVSDKEKCFDAGMDGYLSKPVAKAVLSDKIIEILKNSK